MKFKHFFRRRSLFAAIASAAALTACADSTAPSLRSGYLTSSAAVYSSGTLDIKSMYPKLIEIVPSLVTQGDTTVEKFAVKPNEGRLIKFGKGKGHQIAIPPNVICDPKTTAYGPTEWKKPCAIFTKQIDFTVKSWTDALGRSHADFSPDVRFNPAATFPVRIFFAETTLSDFTSVVIPYCSAPGVCVDESITDATQTTYAQTHPLGGYWVWRMLRHFSGYNVTAY
jgi:hypothetical protein